MEGMSVWLVFRNVVDGKDGGGKCCMESQSYV
jgi:hypothetical protein